MSVSDFTITIDQAELRKALGFLNSAKVKNITTASINTTLKRGETRIQKTFTERLMVKYRTVNKRVTTVKATKTTLTGTSTVSASPIAMGSFKTQARNRRYRSNVRVTFWKMPPAGKTAGIDLPYSFIGNAPNGTKQVWVRDRKAKPRTMTRGKSQGQMKQPIHVMRGLHLRSIFPKATRIEISDWMRTFWLREYKRLTELRAKGQF